MSSNDKKAKGTPTTESADKELSAEELERVAGGFNPQPDPPKVRTDKVISVEPLLGDLNMGKEFEKI